MATLTITPQTTVREFVNQFVGAFGGALRIFNGRQKAEPYTNLVSLGAKPCTITVNPQALTVGEFEKNMQDQVNLKVNVFTADEWVAVLDGILISSLPDLPKAATKAKLEPFVNFSSPMSGQEAGQGWSMTPYVPPVEPTPAEPKKKGCLFALLPLLLPLAACAVVAVWIF